MHVLRLNGTDLDVAAAFDGHRIALTGLAETNEVEVVADCAYSRTGEGLHRFVDPVDGEAYLYTQFETNDAHRMYACFDQPDLKAVFRLDGDHAGALDGDQQQHVGVEVTDSDPGEDGGAAGSSPRPR